MKHGMEWDQAWLSRSKRAATRITRSLREALGAWPLPLFARLLPRHLEIIYEINRRFLDHLRLVIRMTISYFGGFRSLMKREINSYAWRHLASVGSTRSTASRLSILSF